MREKKEKGKTEKNQIQLAVFSEKNRPFFLFLLGGSVCYAKMDDLFGGKLLTRETFSKTGERRK